MGREWKDVKSHWKRWLNKKVKDMPGKQPLELSDIVLNVAVKVPEEMARLCKELGVTEEEIKELHASKQS